MDQMTIEGKRLNAQIVTEGSIAPALIVYLLRKGARQKDIQKRLQKTAFSVTLGVYLARLKIPRGV
jgi:hypothetical protein